MSENFPTKWKQTIFDRIFDAYKDAYKVRSAGQLAALLTKKFGIHRQTVYDWRRGKSKPTEQLLESISKDIGMSVKWFLTGKWTFKGEEDHIPINAGTEQDQEGCNYLRALPDDVKSHAIVMLKALYEQHVKQDKGLTDGMKEVRDLLADDSRRVQDYADTTPYSRTRSAVKKQTSSKGSRSRKKPSPSQD